MPGLFNALISLESVLGLFFIPYTVDRFGRKAGIIAGCFTILLAVGLQSGTQNLEMFIAVWLLLGFSDNVVLGAASPLVAEIAYPQDRAVPVTLSAASYLYHSWPFLAAWVTYGTLQI